MKFECFPHAAVDKTAKLWDVCTGKCVQTFSGHTAGISDCSWSSDSRFVCTASDDNRVNVWNVNEVCPIYACFSPAIILQKKFTMDLVDHSKAVFCVNYNPQSSLIARFASTRTAAHLHSYSAVLWTRRSKFGMFAAENA